MMTFQRGRIEGAAATRSTSAAARVLRFVLAAVAGLALGIVALLVAVLVGATLVVRRLLGRRGPVTVRYFRRPPARRTPGGGVVIDVEAREVPGGKD